MSGISKRVSGSWVSGDYGIMKTATDTLTTLPADLYADGTNATVGISGNMVQSGTPTPQNPIQPSECGEMTENLFNVSLTQGVWAGNTGESPYVSPSTRRICTSNIINLDSTKTYTLAPRQSDMYVVIKILDSNGNIVSDSGWKTSVTFSNAYGILATFRFANESDITPQDFMGAMLNSGSTELPYEPYGYKIPISSASTTTTVYLGEVESTRQIREVVFKGDEEWSRNSGNSVFYLAISDGAGGNAITSMCTEYPAIVNVSAYANMTDKSFCIKSDGSAIWIRDTDISSATDFKTHLAQQYAAGTPVCVWYVLAEPTTGIVNEPIRKISDYADTVSGISIPTIAGANSFDVLTTLKPSEVTANYHGWHTGAVHERDNGQWD